MRAQGRMPGDSLASTVCPFVCIVLGCRTNQLKICLGKGEVDIQDRSRGKPGEREREGNGTENSADLRDQTGKNFSSDAAALHSSCPLSFACSSQTKTEEDSWAPLTRYKQALEACMKVAGFKGKMYTGHLLGCRVNLSSSPSPKWTWIHGNSERYLP